jgi:3-hydroxyisobutyrate dehydrogenase
MQNGIAFLGLGRMGSPMAVRLAAAGHDVTVWNRTPGKAGPAVAAGAREAATAQEAVTGHELVFTMLSDPDAVLGVLRPLTFDPGTTVVEMSTIGPAAVATLRELLPGDVELLDAPVLGSVPQATAGTLHIFAGGPAEVLAQHRKVLEVLGTPQHAGDLGAGAAVKLIVNVATINAITLLGESLGLAGKLGVDREAAFEALSRTTLAPIVSVMRPRVGAADQPTLFELGLAEKDLRLALAAGAAPDGVVAAAQRELAAALRAGLGGRDISAVITNLADQ